MTPTLHPLALAENMRWATRIYQKLMRLAPNFLHLRGAATFMADGHFAPINLEILEVSKGYRRISLKHCWNDSNGDLIADPIIVIAIYPDWEMAEALTYQDMFSQEAAYPNGDCNVNTKVYQAINRSLEQWLDLLLTKKIVRWSPPA